MIRFWSTILLLCLFATLSSAAQTNRFIFTTLNCYWYFASGNRTEPGARLSENEWDRKADNLAGLLPPTAPLFVALQEIGTFRDVERIAYAASMRYQRRYLPLFVQGKDTATGQDVAALLDSTSGWGVFRRPARVAELEKDLSKHLVLRLTNAWTHLDLAIVHLRVPGRAEALNAQKDQARALLRWTMRHLSQNTNANLVILGDFNELQPVGSPRQSLAPLFSARPPMIDTFSFIKGQPSTHADGKALDRIFISSGLLRGTSGLRFGRVAIPPHPRANKRDRRLYTDHYAVSALLIAVTPTRDSQEDLKKTKSHSSDGHSTPQEEVPSARSGTKPERAR